MAQDMDKVMDMTLDEYIASFKAEKQAGVNAKNENKFKEGRRVKNENEEDDEKDMDVSSVIWKGPSAQTNYIDFDKPEEDDVDALVIDVEDMNDEAFLSQKTLQNPKARAQNQQIQRYQPRFDLRDKISCSPSASSDLVPNSNSQQWRLMQPNVMSQRPAGMPPLVPQSTFEDRRSHQQNQKRNRFQKNRYNNRNGYNKNANGNGFFNNSNMFNNGRIQRNNQRNSNQEMLNKNIKAVLDNLNAANGHVFPPKVVDLAIQVPSHTINLTSNPYPSSTFGQVPVAAPTVVENKNFQIAGNNGSNKSNDNLRALLGISDTNCIKTEMMPMLASKFLDFFQNAAQQTTHKPIYDMKIQKEIHNIQKKPLMYKCPGGEVVSSDGSGVNCHIIPRTSGMSLNHRFA